MNGTIKAIYLRPKKHADPVSVQSAQAVVGTGLEGDHFKKKDGLRQVTIMAQEDWDKVCKDLGADLDPLLRRANIITSNIVYNNTVGQILQISDVTIRIEGETKPCRVMDEAHPGLKEALSPNWRGGVYGKIITSGVITIEDKVSWK